MEIQTEVTVYDIMHFKTKLRVLLRRRERITEYVAVQRLNSEIERVKTALNALEELRLLKLAEENKK